MTTTRRRAAKASVPARPPAPFPVEVRHLANPLAWRAALDIAGGDAKRLTPMSDGSVLIDWNGGRAS